MTTLPGHKAYVNCTSWLPSNKFAFKGPVPFSCSVLLVGLEVVIICTFGKNTFTDIYYLVLSELLPAVYIHLTECLFVTRCCS